MDVTKELVTVCINFDLMLREQLIMFRSWNMVIIGLYYRKFKFQIAEIRHEL